MIQDEEDRYMSVRTVAKMFDVKPATVRLWMREGKIKGVKLPGGQWRVLNSTVQEFAQEMYGRN